MSKFPKGLRVLLIDDGSDTLFIQRLLQICDYKVTTCTTAKTALSLLHENKSGFDIMLCEVHLPDMDGFELLGVGAKFCIPVALMSYDSDFGAVVKGIRYGACDYLLKPLRFQELQNLWQHVVRRKEKAKQHQKLNSDASKITKVDVLDFTSHPPKLECITKENSNEKTETKVSSKKNRVNWTPELHQKFTNATVVFGSDAKPGRIAEFMNVPGLSKAHIASHIQRLKLSKRKYAQTKRKSSDIINSSNPQLSGQAVGFRAQEPNIPNRPLFPMEGNCSNDNQVNQFAANNDPPTNLSRQFVYQASNYRLHTSQDSERTNIYMTNQVNDESFLVDGGSNYFTADGMEHAPVQNQNNAGAVDMYNNESFVSPLSYVNASNGQPAKELNDATVISDCVSAGVHCPPIPSAGGPAKPSLEKVQDFGAATNTASEQGVEKNTSFVGQGNSSLDDIESIMECLSAFDCSLKDDFLLNFDCSRQG